MERKQFQSAGNGRPSAGGVTSVTCVFQFQSAGNGRPSAGGFSSVRVAREFQSAGNGRPSAGASRGALRGFKFQSAGNGRPSAGALGCGHELESFSQPGTDALRQDAIRRRPAALRVSVSRERTPFGRCRSCGSDSAARFSQPGTDALRQVTVASYAMFQSAGNGRPSAGERRIDRSFQSAGNGRPSAGGSRQAVEPTPDRRIRGSEKRGAQALKSLL